jgi:hypothetical protein
MEVITSTKFIDAILRDIQLHVTKPLNPNSPSRAISKALKNDKPGRYFMNGLTVEKDGIFSLPLIKNIEIAKLMEKAMAEKKRFRLFVPKSGLMVYAGKDTVEFIEAHKKKALDKARR